MDWMDRMTDWEVETVWKYGGFGDGAGVSTARKRIALIMGLRGVTRRGRRSLARRFARFAPHFGLVAVASLLRLLVRPPVGVPLPVSVPVAPMVPQAGHGVLAPTRGSPWPSALAPAGVSPT